MSSATGAGSRKEKPITIDDLAKQFAALEELLRLLKPLADNV
jgi:hypothetical protein